MLYRQKFHRCHVLDNRLSGHCVRSESDRPGPSCGHDCPRNGPQLGHGPRPCRMQMQRMHHVSSDWEKETSLEFVQRRSIETSPRPWYWSLFKVSIDFYCIILRLLSFPLPHAETNPSHWSRRSLLVAMVSSSKASNAIVVRRRFAQILAATQPLASFERMPNVQPDLAATWTLVLCERLVRYAVRPKANVIWLNIAMASPSFARKIRFAEIRSSVPAEKPIATKDCVGRTTISVAWFGVRRAGHRQLDATERIPTERVVATVDTISERDNLLDANRTIWCVASCIANPASGWSLDRYEVLNRWFRDSL